MKKVLVCDIRVMFDMEPYEDRMEALARLKKIISSEGLDAEYYNSKVVPFKKLEENVK